MEWTRSGMKVISVSCKQPLIEQLTWRESYSKINSKIILLGKSAAGSKSHTNRHMRKRRDEGAIWSNFVSASVEAKVILKARQASVDGEKNFQIFFTSVAGAKAIEKEKRERESPSIGRTFEEETSFRKSSKVRNGSSLLRSHLSWSHTSSQPPGATRVISLMTVEDIALKITLIIRI